MLGRVPRSAAAAPNDTVVAVPVFTTDPHGAAMFAGITNGTLGALGARPVLDTRGDNWHGWTQEPQAPMTGGGNLGGGRPVVQPGSRLDQSAGGIVGDSVMQLFEERATARRFE